MEPLEFEAGDLIKIGDPFTFEEEVQRPEYLRFFTLEEQTLDFFQKSLPTEKIISKIVQKRIKKEIARIEELYSSLVIVTDTEYKINVDRKLGDIPWLKEIYAPYKFKSYSFVDKWIPIMSEEQRKERKYYDRLISAIPMPYDTQGESGVPFTKTSELVKSDGTDAIKALDLFKRTKSIIADNGSENIISLTINNTKDDIRRSGFFIGERKKDMPNPMSEHPFLASSGSSHIETTQPLEEVFPTIEAIMSHAVPTTHDPYIEGRSYYKIYDVKTSQIPWKSWKQRFPPVDTILTAKSVSTINFPDIESPASPSESLMTAYGNKWRKNIFPRFWLMEQVDSGFLPTLMLLSKSSESGTIPPDLMHERPSIIHPPSDPHECIKSGNFTEFMESGIYRDGKCVPISGIVQERSDRISRGKKAWTESVESDILKDHTKLIKVFKIIEDSQKEVKYEHIENKDIGQYRKYVLLLLKDENRAEPDKSRAIRVLVRDLDTSPDNSQYLDEEGRFVVCKHTLEMLDEDIASDFFKKWTTVRDGKRVCNSCNEEVTSLVLDNQDQYDEDGRLIVSQDTLDKDFKVEIGSDILSLEELKPLFNFDSAGANIFYVLINLFQITPAKSQLEKLLNFIKFVETRAKKEADAKKNGGIAGIACTVILLQTHNPFLIPRRSFNEKTVKLNGFPRDSDDEKEAYSLDFILNCIKKTFETFPYSIKEPITAIIGSVLTSRKSTRDEVIKFLKFAKAGGFKEEFQSAKERYEEIKPDAIIKTQFELPVIMVKKTEYSASEPIGPEQILICDKINTKSFVTSKLDVVLRHKEIELVKTTVSKYATDVSVKWTDFPKIKLSATEVGKLLKKGFPATKKLTNAKKLLDSGSNPDPIAVITLLKRTLDILLPTVSFKILEPYRQFVLRIDTLDDSSFIRDSVKGMYFKLLSELGPKEYEILHEAEKKDLAMNMLFLDIKSVTVEVEKLSSREREEFKRRLKNKSDLERELSKSLLAIGVAEYVITVKDRKALEEEYFAQKMPDEDEDDFERPESRQIDNVGIDEDNERPMSEYDSPNNDVESSEYVYVSDD